MTPRPGLELLDDPRFEEVFARALQKHGLSGPFGHPVRQLLEGRADPRSFQCCGSGCVPCVKDYLGAAEMVLVALEKPARARRKKRWFFF